MNRFITFTRVATDIRYFHPSDAVANTNWDQFMIEGFKKLDQNYNEDLDKYLVNIFKNIAPTVKFNDKSSVELIEPEKYETFEKFKVFRNYGYEGARKEMGVVYDIYSNQISEISKDILDFMSLSILYTKQYNDIVLDLPLIIPVDGANKELNSYNGTPYLIDTEKTSSLSLDNKYGCLTGMSKAWGVFQNFFLYFKDINLNWPNELPNLLSVCLESSLSSNKAVLALSRALNKLEDNHVQIYVDNNYKLFSTEPSYTVPVGFSLVNNKVIVSYLEDNKEISLGDELLKIDGIAVDNVIDKYLDTSWESTHFRKYNIVNNLIYRKKEI